MSLEIGLKGRAETVVVQENTAAAVGSGLVPVFATPSMIALPYHNAWSKFGPGDDSPNFLYLEADIIEGTLILRQGEWGLLELNPSSAANYFLSASVRVWVYLPNFMY